MVDLILSEDNKQYQDLAHDFSQKELLLRSEKFDHTGELPIEIWKKAWEVGLVNVRLPESLGGAGLDLLNACVIAEELGAGCSGIAAAFWGNDLAVAPLMVAGTTIQQKKWLAPMNEEFQLGGYCFPQQLTLKLAQDGDKFSVSGEAIALGATTAKWLFFTAESDGKSTAFAVDRQSAGINTVGPAPRIGLKAADLHTIKFENVPLTQDNLIGKLHQAEELNRSSRVYTAPVLAAYLIGLNRAALENATKYAKERHTFGVPIGNHQAVGFMLADQAKNLEAARLMCHKSAWLADHGEGCSIQSEQSLLFASETAMQGTTDAVQVYGGYGYSREYPVEKLMRDAKTMQSFVVKPQQVKVDIGLELIASV